MPKLYLNKAQFAAELEKCLQCKSKPCLSACPVKCSPYDFIAAAKAGNIKYAAELIATQSPLGETCGLICPDKLCMQACLRGRIDAPINIPAVQAEIMHQARKYNFLPLHKNTEANGKKIAILGLGPSAMGAISELIKFGFKVTVFEKEATFGGALNLIPQERLPREIIEAEWQYLAQNPLIEVHYNTAIENYAELLKQGFVAIVVAIGEQKSRTLGIDGENLTLDYTDYLKNPQKYVTNGNVAVVGGGAVAVDCAVTAVRNGAANVEMFVRRRLCDMRITNSERELLLEKKIDVTTMTRITKIEKSEDKLTAYTCKTRFDDEHHLQDIPHSEVARNGYALIVLALGATRAQEIQKNENIFYAGDFINGSSTAVEALASGKQIAQTIIEKFDIKQTGIDS